jgi:glucose-regulated metallopeptidase M90
MLSKILIAPLVIGALVFLYLAWDVHSDYSIYLVPCTVGIAVIYLLSPQIDWWWFKYHPPKLHDALRHLINTRLPFYQNLPVEGKERFRTRMALYMHANDFTARGMDDMPLDLKGVIAATVVQLTFGLENFLLNKFEHIIVYPHPFPSPQYPDKWHVSEIYEEDGVLMFSAEHLMKGFFQPQKFFSIGLYEYARTFQICYPETQWPSFGADGWGKLEQVSGMSHGSLAKYTGLPEVDPVAVAVAHFIVFPERFRAVMPEEYGRISEILNPAAPVGV